MTKIEGPNALEKGGCANELGADLLSQMFDSFFIIIIEFWGITIDSIFWSVKTLSNFYVLGIYKAGEFLSFINTQHVEIKFLLESLIQSCSISRRTKLKIETF